MAEVSERTLHITLYTNGSGISGKIGAACASKLLSWGSYLGPEDAYTVYAAELYGIFMALSAVFGEMVKPQTARRLKTKTVFIFTDNQAAIHAVRDLSSRVRSEQIILKGIIRIYTALRE